jgi:probable rRNA maturation factor
MATVHFFFWDTKITLTERTKLKAFVKRLFVRENRTLETLNYIFCSDEQLLEINKQYLQHDYYTDIITFDLSESPTSIIGDIYISADRIKENAVSHSNTVKKELHRVIFHGALHLCGYKDKKPADKKLMQQSEDKYLSLYFA